MSNQTKNEGNNNGNRKANNNGYGKANNRDHVKVNNIGIGNVSGNIKTHFFHNKYGTSGYTY